MAIKKANIVFEFIRENEYYVTAEGFTFSKLYANPGVGAAERCNLTGKDRWYIRINPLYDTKSVLDDLTALADQRDIAEKQPESQSVLAQCIDTQTHPELARLAALSKRQRKEELLNRYYRGRCQVYTIQKRPTTSVKVDTYIGDRWFTGIGSSKVNWPDEWDEDEGFRVALRKAIRDIADQIVKEN